jgi:psp operon transcriptional activator
MALETNPPDEFGSNPSAPGRFEAIGQSPAFLDFQERLRAVAPVERPVLLIGERGTGKEMAAQRLHYLSQRWGQPFVTLNCAALAPTLIESELFGHEAGSFTGATRQKIGRFEAANEGTLFLDEISLIPMETQEKILRVVEYGAFERVGGTRPIRVDVRIIGATNVDLSHEAERGQFKRDLLDRLSFEVLFLPPLRERREDILVLANHFANRMAFELDREDIPELSDRATARLLNYSWPGNIRELKNVVERAVYRAESTEIDTIVFDPFQSPYSPSPDAVRPARVEAGKAEAREPESRAPSPLPCGLRPQVFDLEKTSLPDAIREVEICFLREALERARYNQRIAGETLGLTYHQFRRLYRKYQDELDAGEEK